ncbi:helix-turn-helix transcriptional regulator [Acinetobacter variabilis]|uniref:helix-turn-helix domain-containing protein n=1 Tax=Acinetobacter variabilis TaxID=70346 RepID=UPI0030F87235
MNENLSIDDKSILMSFGLSLKKIRLKKNLSQEELAYKSNLHRTYISSVERGERNISLINIVHISKALEIPLYELLEEVQQ